jgi:hypothetical protein
VNLTNKNWAALEVQPTALVLLFDADSALLYSAITNHPERGIATHARGKAWRDRVTRQERIWYPTRSAALAAQAAMGTRGAESDRRAIRRRFPHQPRCRHRNYHMSCAEYEHLISRAGGFRCEICRSGPPVYADLDPTPYVGLNIDHDHALGYRAVRGLLCTGCNAILREVDAGTRAADDKVRMFLANPWHVEVGIDTHGCPPDCPYGSHRR